MNNIFESGDLVAFAAAADSGEDGLLAGEPGTVIDVNGPLEITVSFLRGPSISLSATDLAPLSEAEWHKRKGRLGRGLDPTTDKAVDQGPVPS